MFTRYSLDDIGSGSHVHISLSENGENVFLRRDGTSGYGLSKIAEEYMAGVLNHLPSILAFTAPLPNRLVLAISLTLHDSFYPLLILHVRILLISAHSRNK